MERWLKAYEVAERIGVTPQWVMNQARLHVHTNGQEGIPGIKVGKAWVFDWDDVERTLRRQSLTVAE
jgi:hypothetical protein